jgi:predicted helicase
LHGINEIFDKTSPGIITSRDRFAVALRESELQKRLHDFTDTDNVPDATLRERYGLSDTRGWSVSTARREVHTSEIDQLTRPVLYHPFDWRWIAYDSRIIDWGRHAFMRDMIAGNIALITNRSQEIPGEWTNVLCSDHLVTHHSLSNKEVNYVLPLYVRVQPDEKPDDLFSAGEANTGEYWIENIDPGFRRHMDTKYGRQFTPEQVFGYVYATLHARTYRAAFGEFLRMDFPRIPLCEEVTRFAELAEAGWTLARLHLFRDVPDNKLATLRGNGDNGVATPVYDEATERLWINADQYLAPLPRKAWDVRIGGYRVIYQYLKDRRGYTLTLDEMTALENTVNVLAETADQMEVIDEIYRRAFDDAEAAA